MAASPANQRLESSFGGAMRDQETHVVDKQKDITIKSFPFDQASISADSVQQVSFPSDVMVNVTVDKMPLNEFINYVFSDIFDVNFIADDDLRKNATPITLKLQEKISEQKLYNLTQDILEKHKMCIREKEGVYYILSCEDSQHIAVGIGSSIVDIPETTGQIKQFIPLSYADAFKLYNAIPKPAGLKLQFSSDENMFIAEGNRLQIEGLIRLLQIMDRPAMRAKFIEMLHLKYWAPDEIKTKLSEILQQEGLPFTDAPGRKGIYISTVERLNSLLIFAAQREWVERTKYWVRVLDVPVDKETLQFFLYHPQKSKADELGDALIKILGIEGDEPISRQPETSSNDFQTGGAVSSKNDAKAGSSDTKKKGMTLFVADKQNVRIAVDDYRNALIIYTTAEKYNEIERLLYQLDQMPMQVLLEATLAEVTLTDSLQYGLEWFLKNSDSNQTSTIQTMGGLGLGSGGLDFALLTESEKFQTIVNALAKDDKVKILSSPRLTVRDGKSASFNVGTQVPVITSEATSADAQVEGTSSVVRSVQYRSTGTTLSITPSVHAQGVVTLEISQEVSEAQANNTSDISSPIILNRSISTEVIAADGQTVVLGGLIKENESVSHVKVPVIGDIPVIGHLFKTTSKGTDRTELIIMITPHIIRTTEQIDEFRQILLQIFETMDILEN